MKNGKYIERENLVRRLRNTASDRRAFRGVFTLHDALNEIEECEGFDSLPQKTAKWLQQKTKDSRRKDFLVCSSCLYQDEQQISFPYCPNCGSKMWGG